MLGYGGYIWLQSRKVDVLYQALFGVNGRNGLLKKIDYIESEIRTVDKRIADSRHDINGKTGELVTKQYLNFEKLLDDFKLEVRSREK